MDHILVHEITFYVDMHFMECLYHFELFLSYRMATNRQGKTLVWSLAKYTGATCKSRSSSPNKHVWKKLYKLDRKARTID
ncbi:hypothetical protein CR513_16698, partial [Mucuna pruriens]